MARRAAASIAHERGLQGGPAARRRVAARAQPAKLRRELLEARRAGGLLDHHDDDDDADRPAKASTPRVTFDQLPAGAKDVAKSKDDGLFELEL